MSNKKPVKEATIEFKLAHPEIFTLKPKFCEPNKNCVNCDADDCDYNSARDEQNTDTLYYINEKGQMIEDI